MNCGPFDFGAARERLGYPPEAGSVYGIGLRNSGAPQTLLAVSAPVAAQRVDLLKGVGAPQVVENMGCATVHVSVKDGASHAPFATPPNQRIRLAVDWQTGRGGGSAFIDATQGTMFTMNGATVVNVSATLVSNLLDEGTGLPVPLIGGNDKILEASVQWGTATFQPAYEIVRIPVGVGFGVVPLAIPRQARKVTVYTDTPGTTVTLGFGPAGGFGTGAGIYSSDFTRATPDDAAVPVVAGAETFAMSSTVPCIAVAVFELWL